MDPCFWNSKPARATLITVGIIDYNKPDFNYDNFYTESNTTSIGDSYSGFK